MRRGGHYLIDDCSLQRNTWWYTSSTKVRASVYCEDCSEKQISWHTCLKCVDYYVYNCKFTYFFMSLVHIKKCRHLHICQVMDWAARFCMQTQYRFYTQGVLPVGDKGAAACTATVSPAGHKWWPLRSHPPKPGDAPFCTVSLLCLLYQRTKLSFTTA